MPEVKRKFRLGELLVQEGLITEDHLEDALKRSKAGNTILGETLVEMGLVKAPDLLRIVGQQIGLPSVDLRPGLIDPTIVTRIPKDKAQYYGVIPMFFVEDRLTIAISRPLSIFDFDDLERISDCSIQLVLCSVDAVRQAIDKHYVSEMNLSGLLDSLEASKHSGNSGDDLQQAEQIGEISEDSPIASLVNYILSTAINDKASDIHIEPDGKILRVRYRIDGVLREMMTQKIGLHAAMVSRVKVMAKLDIAERRRPQDGRIQVSISAREIDIRVSTLPTTSGEKVVMRILDSANLVFDLEQLGFRQPLIAKFRRMLERPHGLLLVTGPTGSGKTTTLYSALQILRTPEKNIITIEDPVEYQLGMVNQVQVNEAIDLRFSTVLRSVLRQDPNVVMIGEIRDTETAEVAVQASLTGHLVLSTLHTNDSIGAITRLVNMKVEPFLVGSAVLGVIAQRLARKICQSCKQPYDPAPELRQRLGLQPGRKYAKGAGCKQCYNSGYRGRVGLYEVFEVTADARRLMEQGAGAEQLRQARQAAKETTLFQEGIMAAEAGLTSPEEVLRRRLDPHGGASMTLETLLNVAKERGASDLLIMVGDAPAMRVAGHWQRIGDEILKKEAVEQMCRGMLSADLFEHLARRREMDFCRNVPGTGRVRCNLHYQRDHLAMVLRLVWPNIPAPEALGIPPHVMNMTVAAHGLILISGPTGSGKSTTLAAMIEHINQARAAHVITLEDPIEFMYSNKKGIIEQREIGVDTLTWHDGLRSVLRQAPDVIVLGELRDLESIQIALLAAETGHLVMASVHSSTAHGALMRMVDVFPPSQIDQVQVQLSQSLLMVFAQRLVPGTVPGTRAMAYEILMGTPAVQHLVRNSEYEQIPNMINAGREHGMIGFSQCLQELAKRGAIPHELARHTVPGGSPPAKANGNGRHAQPVSR